MSAPAPFVDSPAVESDGVAIPPLQNGDRLTADEFHRRYEAMPELKKAELIDGWVYIDPTFGKFACGRGRALVIAWLGKYVAERDGCGCEAGLNPTVFLDRLNTPQPDAILRRSERAGGMSRLDGEGYLVGPPELVVEVAASSVSYDLHEKADTYRRHGVREYLVWRVEDRAIDWFANRAGRFEPLSAEGGVIVSEVFDGLRLDVAAALGGDAAAVLAGGRGGDD